MAKCSVRMKNTEAALRWIVGILQGRDIPFEVGGGFAASLYGATRELADIDLVTPEGRFSELLSDVKEHIKFGPAQYRDENWDLLLMTLCYEGQDIDIGGAYTARMFDRNTKEWISLKTDFSRTTPIEVYGLRIPVMKREDLVAYKKMLGREVDQVDLEQMAQAES